MPEKAQAFYYIIYFIIYKQEFYIRFIKRIA